MSVTSGTYPDFGGVPPEPPHPPTFEVPSPRPPDAGYPQVSPGFADGEPGHPPAPGFAAGEPNYSPAPGFAAGPTDRPPGPAGFPPGYPPPLPAGYGPPSTPYSAPPLSAAPYSGPPAAPFSGLPLAPTPFNGMPYPAIPYQAFGAVDPFTGQPLSDKSRATAGLLQLLPALFFSLGGIGRLYAGNAALGAIQLVATLVGWASFWCGFALVLPWFLSAATWMWFVIDGIILLTGRPVDAQGRLLRS
jgi:TM2 domain-containing membrane protein YozV